MKILVIGKDFDGLDIAYRLSKNNEVRVYVQNEDSDEVGDGLVNKVEDYKTAINGTDMVIIDSNGFPALVNWLQYHKIPVVGPNRLGEFMETDRQFGSRLMNSVGVDTPQSMEFENFELAKKYISKNPDYYVVKPDNSPVFMTYVGKQKDGADCIDMIDFYISKEHLKKKIQIQRRVFGIEVGVYGWFNGQDFLSPIEICLEHKSLCNGEIGPLTGEMGSVLIMTDKNNKLFKLTIEKTIPFLKKIRYVGCTGINLIVNKDKFWGLEFSNRFGYPAVYIEMELLDQDLGDFFFKLATGNINEFKVKNQFGLGVVMALPDFPYSEAYEKHSAYSPIFGITKDNSDKVHLSTVMIKNGKLVSAGHSADPIVVTDNGKTLQEARCNCYNIVKQINSPNIFYRTDIGGKIDEDRISNLKEWGYL